jgi:hypothetical protein
MNECHFKVKLPGTFFRRKQRWWWRVRLPGEDRMKSRSLRPDGDQCGTKSRETAVTLAFDLWQQALVAETEARLKLESRYQAQEKARAYADLVDRLSTRARRLIVRQARESKSHKPNGKRTAQSRSKPSQTSRNGAKQKERVVKALASPILISPNVDLGTSIVKTARCDCCATPFIPEVELSQIESGQNLCSKCMYYLRDAECRHKSP